MNFTMYLAGWAVVIIVLWFVVGKLTRMGYRPFWVEKGREDRANGRRRFVARHGWIQDYYDRGYYAPEREEK